MRDKKPVILEMWRLFSCRAPEETANKDNSCAPSGSELVDVQEGTQSILTLSFKHLVLF